MVGVVTHLAWLGLGIPAVLALQVTPGSPCAALCLSGGEEYRSAAIATTEVSEISCRDNDFDYTDEGQKFEKCISCLQSSTWTNGTESDVAWLVCMLTHLASK
jgi:hypothetical protein